VVSSERTGQRYRQRLQSSLFRRYLVVSVVGVVAGHVLLWGLHTVGGVGPLKANLASTTINTCFILVASRKVIWRTGRSTGLRSELTVFVLMALLGLVVSTIAVWVTVENVGEALWVNVANLLGFGLIWLLRFFVLDGYIYVDPGPLLREGVPAVH